MKPKAYIETSVISYYTARISRDLIVAAHQEITQDWWDNQRSAYDLYTSMIVHEEASAGDSNAATKRIRALKEIQLLDVNNEAAELAGKLIMGRCLPKKATEDALHIAVAAVHGMEFLITWNCKHIANAQMRAVIEKVILQNSYQPPIICTPEELPGEQDNVE